MRKKWVIIAAVSFLVIVCGVFVLANRNSYSAKAVLAEVCKDSKYVDQMISVHGRHRSHPSPLDKLTNWYKYNVSFYYHQSLPIDPYKPILLFYEDESVVVSLTFKMGLVNSVIIKDFTGSYLSALKLKSRLCETFPNLSCKIITL